MLLALAEQRFSPAWRLELRRIGRDAVTADDVAAIRAELDRAGVIDEVEINGVTWVRYTSEAGAVSLFVEAPSGKTVSMVIGSKVTWDDALLMAQNVVLK